MNDRPSMTHWFFPSYTEVSLFVSCLSFSIIFLISPEMQNQLFFSSKEGLRFPVVFNFFGFCLGVALSTMHLFIKRNKYTFEKWAMLLCVTYINFFAAYHASMYMIKQELSIAILFPLWNLFYSILLLFMARVGLMSTHHIIDKNASVIEILIAAISLGFIIVWCQSYFNFYWAITLSISMTYATLFSERFVAFFSTAHRI